FHLEIRRHSMVLDIPFASRAVERQVGGRYKSAVDKLRKTEDPNQTAPCALAHQRPHVLFAKHPRQGITAGPREFVNHHDFGTEDSILRSGEVGALSSSPETHQRPLQVINHIISYVAAAVKTLVNDCGFLP